MATWRGGVLVEKRQSVYAQSTGIGIAKFLTRCCLVYAICRQTSPPQAASAKLAEVRREPVADGGHKAVPRTTVNGL